MVKMSLKYSQRKLIKDLKGSDIKIWSSKKRLGELERHLSKYYALILLYGVDNVDQMKAILPIKNFLHGNSLLLLTLHNK